MEQMGNVTLSLTVGLRTEKKLPLLKVKVAAQEAEVYIPLSKPSQTSNSTVNTHMET